MLYSLFLSLFSSFQGCEDKSYSIPYYNEKIKVDGQARELAWTKCESYTKFLNPWNQQLDQGTTFKTFNDGEFLNFHFEIRDSLIICHEDVDHDTVVEYSDRVELFFARDTAMNAYCGLEFDACGRKQEFYANGYRNFVKEWTFPSLNESDYKHHKLSNGYAIEGRLSLASIKEMGFLVDEHIYLGIFRADRYGKKNIKSINWISWKDIDTPKPDFHTIKGFNQVQIEKQ